jgi:polyisoprenoid-binding protein YceI
MTGADYCGANAVTKVKRTEFNMGKYAPNVGDDVTITIAIEAAKKE